MDRHEQRLYQLGIEHELELARQRRTMLWRCALLILIAVVALLAPLAAQTIAFANPAEHRQARWVVVPMPAAQADLLPRDCVVGDWLATKGRKLANHTQLWHVRTDLRPHQAGQLATWRPLGAPFPAFMMSPWISDDLGKMVPKIQLAVGSSRRTLVPSRVELVEDGVACKVWRASGSSGGWHFVAWAKTWSWQDAVDLRGYIVWSDPTSPAWWLDEAQVSIETGEPLELYFATRCGFTKTAAGTWTLWRGRVPHGVAIPFRGVVLPTDDGGGDPHGLSEWRREQLAAAAEAPVLASCDWRQDWLAFGVVPRTSVRSDWERFDAFLRQPGGLFDARPLANGLDTGGTGAQAPFGATKDLIALQGDAWRVYELLYSADDYLLRGRHHRELDGRVTTKAIRPRLETWSGSPFAGDTIGKAMPAPWGWHLAGDRVVLVDDQHRGDAYILAAYALTGDEALADDLLDSIAVDETRAFPRRGWIDAPRATGRLWQSWAKMTVLFDGATRARLRALAVAELVQREAQQPMGTPVSPAWTVRDDRVLPGADAWVPWNDSLLALGAMEQAAAWRRVGDLQLAARFQAYGVRIGRNVVQWGTVRTSFGSTLPLTGVKWAAGGAAQLGSYYTYPRAGAAESPGPGVDMLVGTPGWWTWFAGSLAAAQVGPQDDVRARAAAIWAEQTGGQQSVEALEWWAVR